MAIDFTYRALDRALRWRLLVDDRNASRDGAISQSAQHFGTTIPANQPEFQCRGCPIHSSLSHPLNRLPGNGPCTTCSRFRLEASGISGEDYRGRLADAAVGDLLHGRVLVVNRTNDCATASSSDSSTVRSPLH